MITFYLVCKNGEHSYTTNEEIVERIEVDCEYKEGLKMLRCVVGVLKDFIRLGKIIGRVHE